MPPQRHSNPDSDYQAASGTLTFAPGEKSKTITVLVNDNPRVESNEVFAVNLSNAVGATILDGQDAGTSLNDDFPPAPAASASSAAPAAGTDDLHQRRDEGRGPEGAEDAVHLHGHVSAPSATPVTISYQTVNGTAKTSNSDYVAKSGTITFAPGETSKTITITVKGDSKRESNEGGCSTSTYLARAGCCSRRAVGSGRS
jgi:chitinase